MFKRHAANFSEMLQETWRIFSVNFFQLLGILLIAFLIFIILTAALGALFFALFGFNMALTGGDWNIGLLAGAALAVIVVMAVGILTYSFPIMLITGLTEKAIKHQKFDLMKETKERLPDLPAFAATLLLMGVLLIPLFILFIIPGIIFGVFWLFTVQEMVFNRNYGFNALAASKRFVNGRWWQVFGYLILMWAILAVVSWAVEGVVEGIFSTQLAGMISGIISLIMSAFGMVFFTVFFTELRKQRGEKTHV